ncbi:MAG: efflux RND transporter periplasmic adaptor subunit [Tolypothrix carrinoi HA7290-LM1]|jgi:HlyD family secretion protein|nr:efflux RND transporter periplasmic adaptor subunit [Tolypothrix carrinoi HA7290-LM1]
MKLDTSQPVDSTHFLPEEKKKKKGRIRINWIPWLVTFSLLGGVGYVGYRQVVVVQKQEAQRKVLTQPVSRQNLTIKISANGTVKPERSINVSPKQSGILKRLLVKEGDTVKQGQILAYMDDSNLQGQLTQARGQIAQQEANLQKAIAGNRPQDIASAQAALDESQANLQKAIAGNRPQDIASAQAALDESQANLQKAQTGNRPQDIGQAQARLQSAQASLSKAEDDLRRNQQLYKSGAISLQIVNQSRADRDSAQGQVNEAIQALGLQKAGSRSEDIEQARAVVRQRQQALALLKAGSRPEDIEQARAVVRQKQQALALLKAGSRPEDIEQARAQLASARGSLQTIQTQINDTILRAPFDGVITQKYADPGAFVTPTTSGSAVSSATSSSIVSLASTNQVVANIAEVNIAKIRLGQKVTITADAYPGKTFEGKVSQIAAQAIVEQNVTSFQVKIAIVSDTEKLLRSGMNVTTDFEVGQLSNVLVVPTAAVVRREKSTGVFVAGEDNKPVFTRIKTGVTVDKYTEVKSGLKGNERVLLSFPPGSRPQSTPRGGVFPGVGGGGGGGRGGGGRGGPP